MNQVTEIEQLKAYQSSQLASMATSGRCDFSPVFWFRTISYIMGVGLAYVMNEASDAAFFKTVIPVPAMVQKSWRQDLGRVQKAKRVEMSA